MIEDEKSPEPWLCGTLTEVDAVRRQVLHALELADLDVKSWCKALTDAEMHMRPFGIASVAFQMRHIARSLDRLLAYAEGEQLSAEQRNALTTEMDESGKGAQLFEEFRAALVEARLRILAISSNTYEEPRGVGRKMLPSTVGGLLVHCAEHTQRHVGQAITTAKVVVALRR